MTQSDGRNYKVPVVLSIAGSDNTGGAGIQADIKTCCAFKVYAATVVTAITAQNSHGVKSVEYVGREMLIDQIETLLNDYRPDAVKIGMLPNPEAVEVVADAIARHLLPNVVFDPVIRATAADASLSGETGKTARAMVDCLFPLCTVITPNIPEYEYFTSEFDLHCFRKAKAMLLKGGHGDCVNCVDRLHLFGSAPREFVYSANKIDTRHTHGTGCVLSSAIACGLAKGENIPSAVGHAKKFVDEAIRKGAEFPVTENYGPLYLF